MGKSRSDVCGSSSSQNMEYNHLPRKNGKYTINVREVTEKENYTDSQKMNRL